MANVAHSSLTGEELHGPFHYVTGTDPGAVGAGRFWLDISGEPFEIKVRNSANTDWVDVGAAGGGSSPGPWDVLIRPVSGNYRAYDRDGVELASNSALHTLFAAVALANRHIHFASGDYTCTSEMALLTGMTVGGEGWGTYIHRSTAGNIFTMSGTISLSIAKTMIRNMRLEGPSLIGAQVQGNGIFVSYIDVFEIHHVFAQGFGSLGDDGAISLDKGITGGVVHHCHLSASKNGFCAGSPSATDIQAQGCVMHDNWAWDNYDDGMHSQRCRDMQYNHNYCWNNGGQIGGAADGAGIDVLGDEHDSINGNHCYGNDRGIEVGNTASGTYPDLFHSLTGNQCHDNIRYGYTLIGKSLGINYYANDATGNGSDGWRIGTATSTIDILSPFFMGNTAKENGLHGWDIFGYVSGLRATCNNGLDNGNADFRTRVATGTPDDYVIVNNFLRSAIGVDDDAADAGSVITPNFT
jgi:hypothetical protein